jgi:hypothetical protein
MNSPSNTVQVALECPASERTEIRRIAQRSSLGVEAFEYHLLKPRTSRHPLLKGAYELWRDEWRATLEELEGSAHIHSDEFVRQDEISVLSVDQQCVSVTGLRWLDLSLPMAREDSYFRGWPDDMVQRLGSGVVGISGNTIVRSEWRRTLIDPSSERPGEPMPLSLVTLALALRRFIDVPTENVIGVSRNDRSMNRVGAAIGALKIGQITIHGVDSDVMIVPLANAAPRGAVVDALWGRRHQE